MEHPLREEGRSPAPRPVDRPHPVAEVRQRAGTRRPERR